MLMSYQVINGCSEWIKLPSSPPSSNIIMYENTTPTNTYYTKQDITDY